VHPKKIINKSELDDLCNALLSIDTDIQDIILRDLMNVLVLGIFRFTPY